MNYQPQLYFLLCLRGVTTNNYLKIYYYTSTYLPWLTEVLFCVLWKADTSSRLKAEVTSGEGTCTVAKEATDFELAIVRLAVEIIRVHVA